MPKYEIHQRTVTLTSDFSKAWEFLSSKGEITLRTEKNRIPFIVKASVTKRGKHEGERVIRFLNADSRRVLLMSLNAVGVIIPIAMEKERESECTVKHWTTILNLIAKSNNSGSKIFLYAFFGCWFFGLPKEAQAGFSRFLTGWHQQ